MKYQCAKIIKSIVNILYKKPGHYPDHAYRTANIMKIIAVSINYPQEKAWITGMLHDIGLIINKKYHAYIGAHIAKFIILFFCPNLKNNASEISYAIKWHNRISAAPKKTTLLKLLVDADTIDLLGIIGAIRGIQDNSKLKIHTNKEKLHENTYYNGKITAKQRNIDSIIQLLLYLQSMINNLNYKESKKIAKLRIQNLKYLIKTLKLELKNYEIK